MTHARQNALVISLVLVAGLFMVTVGLGVFAMDYLETRSAARLAMLLTRLGPGTPLESYIAEFGETTYHYTGPDKMKYWGPSTDDSLLSKTDLYYFCDWGIPHRFVVVYVDKNTHRSVLVTWKGM
jgi:hypothetical protein